MRVCIYREALFIADKPFAKEERAGNRGSVIQRASEHLYRKCLITGLWGKGDFRRGCSSVFV